MNVVGLAPQLVISALAALVGMILNWRGLFRSRFGAAPHCRNCGYNLTGSPELKCPECGRVNGPPRGPILGERRVSRQRVWVGALFFVIGTSLLVRFAIPIVQAVKWYQYAPLVWVVDDLTSGSADRVYRAYDEIGRRFWAGRLSNDQVRTIADVCLREEALPNLSSCSSVLIQLASTFFRHDALSTQQRQSFLQHLVTYELVTRRDVIANRPFAVRLQYDLRGRKGEFYARFNVLRWRVNGENQPVEPLRWAAHPLAGRGHRATVGVVCHSPGPTTIEADIEATFTLAAAGSSAPSKNDSVSSTVVKVSNALATEPDDYVRVVRNTDLDAAVTNAVRVSQAYVIPTELDLLCQGGALLELEAASWPKENLYFQATIFGNDHIARNEAQFTAQSPPVIGLSIPPGERGPLTVLLRPDRERAVMTVDVESIWGGCLVFDGIGVDDAPKPSFRRSNHAGRVAEPEECDQLESDLQTALMQRGR